MKTDIIKVSSKGIQMEAALEQVEKVAAYKDLSRKNALHLRLLTEEMMGMMRSVTGETEGEFWIEDEDGEYRLHLRIAARLNPEKREQLLSASSTGKNESAKGLMGRLRAFFDWSCDEDADGFSSPVLLPDAFEYSSAPALVLPTMPVSEAFRRSGMIMPWAPPASAERMMAPRLCGSSMPSHRRMKGASPRASAAAKISSTVL